MARRQREVRALLHAYPEGLTAKQIADQLEADIVNIHAVLKLMVDTYIVGWTEGRPRALWAAAVIPQDCPRPMKQDRVLKAYAR